MTTEVESLQSPLPKNLDHCAVCGNGLFTRQQILWAELIQEWDLSPEEAEYIDVQQGVKCVSCGCNVRGIALARALNTILGPERVLADQGNTRVNHRVHILEVNAADGLSSHLSKLRGYTRLDYPELNLEEIDFPENEFDIMIHSDTLEHVPNADLALSESFRVIRPGGWLIFTVPIVLGRFSRSRNGLPPSYHGVDQARREDYLVHTEFGADVWVKLMSAGFESVTLQSFSFPSGIAIAAQKPDRKAASKHLRNRMSNSSSIQMQLRRLAREIFRRK